MASIVQYMGNSAKVLQQCSETFMLVVTIKFVRLATPHGTTRESNSPFMHCAGHTLLDCVIHGCVMATM